MSKCRGVSEQVATWVDDTLMTVASKLEHSAQTFPELQGERIVSLHCCALYSCVQLDSSLYWWGVLPVWKDRDGPTQASEQAAYGEEGSCDSDSVVVSG